MIFLKKNFESKVDYNGDCFEWMASKNIYGYGQIMFNRKNKRAHHLAWFLEYGYWPYRQLNHFCGNPSCVRISHLYDGSQKQNIIDIFMNNNHGNQKVSKEQVIEIRNKYKKECYSQKLLSEEYGLSQSHVSRIVNGNTWSFI